MLYIVLFYLIFNCSSVFAQETFFSTFSSNDIERGTSLLITSDNHLLMAGTNSDEMEENTQIIVIKTDMDGKVIWSRKYGSLIAPEANVGLLESNSGNFVMSATSHQVIPNDWSRKNIYTFSIDSDGYLLWENLSGGFAEQLVTDITKNPFHLYSPEFFIVGHTTPLYYEYGTNPLNPSHSRGIPSTFDMDTVGHNYPIANWSPSGNQLILYPIEHTFQFISFIKFPRIQQQEWGGYRQPFKICIEHNPLEVNNINSLIMGSEEGVFTIGSQGEDVLYRGIVFEDDLSQPFEYLTVGYTNSHGNGSKDIWVVSFTDAHTTTFNPIKTEKKWEKTFRTSLNEVATDIDYANADRNGFIIGGYLEEENTTDADTDIFLMKIDRQGNLLWSKVYPQSHSQTTAYSTASLAVSTDGTIYLVGTSTNQTNKTTIFLLKTDSQGNMVNHCSSALYINFEEKLINNESNYTSDLSHSQIMPPFTATLNFFNPSPFICIENQLICGINSPDTLTIDIGEQASLNTHTAISYQWSPTQSLDNPSRQNPIASPLENTLYQVTLTDVNGCTDTDAIFVEVLPIPLQIAIPSAFTPNQDGYNDVFQVTGKGFEFLQLTIYNRWGKKVFETTDSLQSWDGTVDFERQPLGVYAYSLQYQTIGSETLEEKTGFVSLLY